MSDQHLGVFSEGFANWRRLLAAMPDAERRLTIFANAAAEVATYVAKGLNRVVAADELVDMANGNGLDDADAVQAIIAEQFQYIEEPDHGDPATNGHDKNAPVLLHLINLRAWQGIKPKPREWIVQERIPARNVTLLTGQGGVGKTLLMQQLSVATVLARDWIGVVPEPGPVLFITAEDDENELHFRYHRIAEHYETTFDALADAGLHLLSLAGKDAVMATADNKGVIKPTELFKTMRRTVEQIRPRWVCLDTAADIFIVNERDRSQVRQCISFLRGIALDFDTSVILLSHPSLTGISTGTGLSGSTAWNNSVRSRLYLKTEKKKDKNTEEEEDEVDTGAVRILEFMKSNYSALAASVKLTWRDGLLLPDFVPTLSPIDRSAVEQKARDLFVYLLHRYNTQDRTVSYKEDARNFAPKVFAGKEETFALHKNEVQRKRLLRVAMDELLDKGKIETGTGPKSHAPSKRFPCLYTSGSLL